MTRPAPRSRPSWANYVMDVVFTLIVPLACLRPVLPFTDQGLGMLVGPVAAYLTASLVPVTYLLLSVLLARRVNTVTTLAAASALMSGALAFWPLSGVAFAIKDSSGSLFLLMVTSGSLWLRRPLFTSILQVALLPGTPRQEMQLRTLLATPGMYDATRRATVALQLKALLVASTNIIVKSAMVSAPFGTQTFNSQLASATAVMIPLAYLASAAGYGLALWFIRRGFTRLLGRTVPMWGEGFWKALPPN
ncbi:VC0807 family protein [Deinococcus peraridilitoris]|uniref:Uncharacterized protein n=1 Tax=Deinococcus peraridilitoris (strain DSM 19664 / LMG 22246 / CIP 109416 / KR-200) TaxID=937777 RepID=L0A5C1_DEIPD|nr:VC0807 family protein [Deinococcus peraridilitoris]AFZ69066.1 hypothetical protein Deipe_3640 [Deinococcus peraridilitoris DSM 19664]